MIQHQGSDFAGAYFYSCFYGGALYAATKEVVDRSRPKTRLAKTLNKHATLSRDAIGFSLLTAYEVYQSVSNHKPLDIKDIAAYGLGIATLGYGHKIARGFYNSAKDICHFTRQCVFPTAEEKMVKSLLLKL